MDTPHIIIQFIVLISMTLVLYYIVGKIERIIDLLKQRKKLKDQLKYYEARQRERERMERNTPIDIWKEVRKSKEEKDNGKTPHN